MNLILRDFYLIALILLLLIIIIISFSASVCLNWYLLADELKATPLVTFSAILDCIVAFITMIGGLYAFNYWKNRPKFIIGLIDTEEAKFVREFAKKFLEETKKIIKEKGTDY